MPKKVYNYRKFANMSRERLGYELSKDGFNLRKPITVHEEPMSGKVTVTQEEDKADDPKSNSEKEL